MEDHGIAWMISGGVRAQSAEDRRQRFHRVAIALSRPANDDILFRLRRQVAATRIVEILRGRSDRSADSIGLNPDCCPA